MGPFPGNGYCSFAPPEAAACVMISAQAPGQTHVLLYDLSRLRAEVTRSPRTGSRCIAPPPRRLGFQPDRSEVGGKRLRRPCESRSGWKPKLRIATNTTALRGV